MPSTTGTWAQTGGCVWLSTNAFQRNTPLSWHSAWAPCGTGSIQDTIWPLYRAHWLWLLHERYVDICPIIRELAHKIIKFRFPSSDHVGSQVIPPSLPAEWTIAHFLWHFNGLDYPRVHGLPDIPVRFARICGESSFVPDPFHVPSCSRRNYHLRVAPIHSWRTKIPTNPKIPSTNQRHRSSSHPDARETTK